MPKVIKITLGSKEAKAFLESDVSVSLSLRTKLMKAVAAAFPEDATAANELQKAQEIAREVYDARTIEREKWREASMLLLHQEKILGEEFFHENEVALNEALIAAGISAWRARGSRLQSASLAKTGRSGHEQLPQTPNMAQPGKGGKD